MVTHSLISADVTIDGFTIKGGEADGSSIDNQGAAIQIRSSAKCIAGGITVSNCIITDNHALHHGAVNDHSLASTFDTCTFSNNKSAKGAGLLVHHGSPTIKDCVFDGNETNAEPHQGGGAWFGHDTDATCTGSSAPTVTDCVFKNNQADDEGAGLWVKDSDVTMSGTRFETNELCHLGTCTVLTYGGAIWMSDSTSTITGCDFVGNTANEAPYGIAGAFYINNSSVDVVDSTFIENETYLLSGAILIVNGTGSTFTNCIFNGNTCLFGQGGGIIIAQGDTIEFTNCTFTENSGTTGGGIYIYSSNTGDVDIYNSIFWNNGGTGETDQIDDDGTGTTTVTFSDWHGHTPEGDNINDDPEFTDPDGADLTLGTEDDDLTLQSSSPCIDDGNNSDIPSGIEEDFAGNCRIENGTVDMGAYEESCSGACCSGVCEECCDDGDCAELCCSNACVTGDCCNSGDCSGGTPICVANTCVECTKTSQCASCELCVGNVCVSDPAC